MTPSFIIHYYSLFTGVAVAQYGEILVGDWRVTGSSPAAAVHYLRGGLEQGTSPPLLLAFLVCVEGSASDGNRISLRGLITVSLTKSHL